MRLLWALALSALSACDGKEGDGGKPTRKTPAPTKKVDPEAVGTVEGAVAFTGTAPPPKRIEMGTPECRAAHPNGVDHAEVLADGGKLQNAFVWIKEGIDEYAFDTPTAEVVVDQKGCMYEPFLTGAQVGQPVAFVNSDTFTHNINGRPKANSSFNFALSAKGQRNVRTFEEPEPEVIVKLRCDIHPWMFGYIGVVPHPHFAITGKDGAFSFKGVPAGRLVVAAWHETLGETTRAVELAPKATARVDLELKSR
jgi:plastocyanin